MVECHYCGEQAVGYMIRTDSVILNDEPVCGNCLSEWRDEYPDYGWCTFEEAWQLVEEREEFSWSVEPSLEPPEEYDAPTSAEETTTSSSLSPEPPTPEPDNESNELPDMKIGDRVSLIKAVWDCSLFKVGEVYKIVDEKSGGCRYALARPDDAERWWVADECIQFAGEECSRCTYDCKHPRNIGCGLFEQEKIIHSIVEVKET